MFRMAAVETSTGERSSHKEFSDSCHNSNYKVGQLYSMTSNTGKPAERPSNISNNNNVLEMSLFTSDGKVLTAPQEMPFGDLVAKETSDLLTPDSHASDADLKESEKHVKVTINGSVMKHYRAEEYKERYLANCANEQSAETSESSAKVKESESLSNDHDVAILEQNGPLSLKERISNIDMSIEWIRGELTLMQAQDLSLRHQFEQLFKDVMELKLHQEMEKDEYQFIEEEISFEEEF